MISRTSSRALWIASLMAVGLLAGCDDGSNPLVEPGLDELQILDAPWEAPVKDPVTVMTRNLYHGGDIGPVLAVGFSNPFALMAAANQVWAEILSNDFHERVVSVVDDIEASMPDIVGLQEAVEFMHMSAAGVEVIDFVQILEDELDQRGLPYSVVAIQDNTVVPVPLDGMVVGTEFVPTEVVQLTERLAVLKRDDFGAVTVSKDNYGATEPLFGPYSMMRGWIRLDAMVDGVPHHFVNTHLEIQAFAETQGEQATELLDEVLDGLDGVTILFGDFNSNASGSPGDPSWTPTYDALVAAGFNDLWLESNPGHNGLGLTCCQASDLRNAVSEYYQRPDLIFYRIADAPSEAEHFPGAIAMDLIGEEQADRTVPNGLWPSDHAGLVADLFWAPGQLFKLR